jgi:hypothetical protein
MALFHFSVTQVKRSAGQSAIASAAYRAGEKLYSDYYGEVSDYTRKGGVIHTDIMLPDHAPLAYADRQTLWNAVEHAERGKKAQLAYSFDIALQNEFTREENLDLVQQFLSEHFLSKGMVIDYALHEPDVEDGGIANPHFHVLCPIRPIEKDGTWGNKQRREYVLDEQGNRTLDEAGKPVFNAVPTTDWGKPETLEAWRQAWAELCNSKFEEKGLSCRIDHRSYARQGLDILPTQHEGPTVRAMEAKGIPTIKGELNRWIKATNSLLKEAIDKIAALLSSLKRARDELAKPQSPLLSEMIINHLTQRNAGAWSNKAKVSNLKEQTQMLNMLEGKSLHTVDDLIAYMDTLNRQLDVLKTKSKTSTARIKELEGFISMAPFYSQGKPVADKLETFHFKSRREAFRQKNEGILRRFYMAQRKLKPHLTKEGKVPIGRFRKELSTQQQAYQAISDEIRPLYAEVKSLWKIRTITEQAGKQQHNAQQARQTNRETR